MAIVAVMMVVGFSAFRVIETRGTSVSTNENTSVRSEYWRFISTNPLDITDPSAYIKTEEEDPDCDGSILVCEIYAPADGIHPDLDAVFDQNTGETYADLIEDAMSGTPSTNDVVVGLKN